MVNDDRYRHSSNDRHLCAISPPVLGISAIGQNCRPDDVRYRVLERRAFKGPAMRIRFALIIAIVTGTAVLSACATKRSEQDARRDYEQSVADYENCLAANQMSTCEGERRIMKANKKVLSATMQRTGR